MASIQSKGIENILFDLGGVLLNIDYTITERAFREMGLFKFNDIYSQSRQDGLFDDFEKGLIGRNEFVSQIQDYFRDEIPSESAIEQAWNAMLIDFPDTRLEMLKMLKADHDLFLVSNTNEIHYEAFKEIFNEAYPEDFSSFFNRDYYSHQLGMRKPDAEIFEHIIDENSLDPTKTLFIDDSKQHIKAAKKLKFNTLQLKKGQEVVVVLHELSILT